MPFRHITLFRWAEHVDAEHVQRVRDAYDELAELIVGLCHHAHGSDAGVSEGSFDFHVVADFETLADWRAYRDHPAHVLLFEELIRGNVIDRAAGQFQLPDHRSAHDVSATQMQSLLAGPDDRPDMAATDVTDATEETDDELLARARRAATAEMQTFLADPDDPT